MAGAIIAPVLIPMGEGVGANPSSARLIITTHGIFIALFSPLSGILIDRFGAKKPFVFGLIIYGISGASGLLITSFWVLIVSRIILGIGISAVYTSITVIILKLYEGRQRNNVMGWRSSSNNLGGVLWPLLGGFLGTFSWQLPFAAYLMGIPFAILAFLSIPETPKVTIPLITKAHNKESVLRLFKNTPLLFVIYGLVFLTMLFLYANVIFIPKLVEQFGTINPFFIGILLSAMGLAGAMTAFMYGRIRVKLSYIEIVIMATLIWVFAFAIMSQASSTWVTGIAIVLFGFGMGLIMPTAMVWTGESVPEAFRGRMLSYLASAGFIGQFMSPIILSPIASSLGLNTVFITVAGVSALLFIAFLAYSRKQSNS